MGKTAVFPSSYLITLSYPCYSALLLNDATYLPTYLPTQAKSGKGKTAVFVLATLHQLTPVAGECHVVVLCHTRELAFQVRDSCLSRL